MSEYHTAQTEFKDKDALVEALKNMGWETQVHDEAQSIACCHARGRKAHIIVRKGQYGGYADMGYEQVEGTFVVHRDSFDSHVVNDNVIKARYAEACTQKVIRGRAKYRRSNRVENEDEIRIKIKAMY